MQALIDFDGWRKWKDFSSLTSSKDSEDKGEKKLASKKKKGSRMSVGSGSGSSTVRPPVREEIVAA